MEKMTKTEMISFLKGMEKKQAYLAEEKKRIKGSVETLDEAIQRNAFSKGENESGVISGSFSPDKVFKVLLNSQRDIEQETRSMVLRMRDIYLEEDRIEFVKKCMLQMNGEDQFLLNEVYIKDIVVESLLRTLNMSRSNMYRLLNQALSRLLDIYNGKCQEVVSWKAKRLVEEVIPYMPEGSIA